MTGPKWPSLLRELARLLALGESFTIESLSRLTGADTRRSAERAVAALRLEAGRVGCTLVVEPREGTSSLIRLSGPGLAALLSDDEPEALVTERSRRRAKIKALGLCVDCKEPAERGGLCPRHHAAARVRGTAWRRKNRERGRCHDCSSKARSGTQFCAKHAESYQLTARLSYHAKRREGRCVCRGEPRPGRALCLRCAAVQAAWHARASAAARVAGRCTKCRRAPTDGETQKCAGCRERHRVASLKSLAKRRASA